MKKTNEVKQFYIGNKGKTTEVNFSSSYANNNLEERKINNEYLNNDYNNISLSGNYAKSTVSVVNVDDYKYDEKLLENPFLYNYSAPEASIKTIEEFYVLKKKKYYLFSSLVRNNDFSLFKRKRMIKDYLKHWKEDAEMKLDRISSIGSSQFQESKLKTAKGFGILDWIISTVAIILAILLVNGTVWKISKPTNDIILMAVYFAFAATILAVLIGRLINHYIRNNKRIYKKNKKEFYKKDNELNRKFKKKYNDTYTYYVKKLSKRFKKEELSIEKTSIETSSIDNVEVLISDNSKKSVAQGKQKDGLVFYRFISKALSYLSGAFLLGLTIFEIIMGLLAK